MEPIDYMKKAIALAKKGRGYVAPNPLVGAVLVKNGQIIGQGYHQKYGGHHAEIEALNNCQTNPKGSTLYVTLEPCCHYGKTPPCTQAIIKAGIKKVFISMIDPNPKIKNRGLTELKQAGIKVAIGLLKNISQKINESYTKYITTKEPFVILKTAMSLDGKIATKTGDSHGIGSSKEKYFTHQLRQQCDAILVGINTVLVDNPHLGVRLIKGRDPKRIILDSNLKIPLNSQVLRDNNLIIVTSDQADLKKIKILKEKNISLIVMKNKINIKNLLKQLGEIGISSILVEGGGEINASFFQAQAVDKIYFAIAPIIIGGKKATSPVGGSGVEKINKAYKIKDLQIKKLGSDILIEGYIKK